jgi:hypothetical protein
MTDPDLAIAEAAHRSGAEFENTDFPPDNWNGRRLSGYFSIFGQAGLFSCFRISGPSDERDLLEIILQV